tara:strand:+ start:207 stop:407 length:201 start_codon:yes stop_codon:yes gene_type:complete
MTILNYFFIGAGFTFVMDLLLSMERIKNHIEVNDKDWGMAQRILCMAIWPIAALTFIIAFIKQFFK